MKTWNYKDVIINFALVRCVSRDGCRLQFMFSDQHSWETQYPTQEEASEDFENMKKYLNQWSD